MENVREFVNLENKTAADRGDCDQKYTTRIGKTNQVIVTLESVLRAAGLDCHTKIKIFCVFLYGSQCWNTTIPTRRKVAVFQNKCCRRMLKTFWPNTISDEDLRNGRGMSTIAETSEHGASPDNYVCGMPHNPLPRTSLPWTLKGQLQRATKRD